MERDSSGGDEWRDGVPRSPSGRMPQWVIDEALDVTKPAQPVRPQPYPAAKAGPSRNSGWRSRVRRLTILVVLGLGALAWSTLKPDGTPYRFLHYQDDGKSPVAYSSCQPIRYVIQRQGELAGGTEIIAAAAARVSQATGLPFAYDGATSEDFSRNRPGYQPGRYGNRWAPVLIKWVARNEDPDLSADALGAAGSSSARVPNGKNAYVTGTVELDAEKLTRMLQELDGRHEVQAVVMHEFGHIVGLDHVNSRSSLMNPEMQRGVTDFDAGDLAGLAVLGRGTCSSAL